MAEPSAQSHPTLARYGLIGAVSGVYSGKWLDAGGTRFVSRNPATDEALGEVVGATVDQYDELVSRSLEAFRTWRMVPAPIRGDHVRRIGNALREHKEHLGALVSLETGKTLAEGLGEVQEMIDIGDFAVGLSRQLYGLTMASERPNHRLYEQWHPLGPVGVITAFNFPVAVWAWNALVAGVCGDTVIWKPSPITPLTSVAVTNIVDEVMAGTGHESVFSLTVGDVDDVGHAMVNDRRIPLISATGSCRMGREVGTAVAARLGRSLLELGGNNAIIVMSDADLDLTVRGALFAALGTSGQRCTSLRRLITHRSVAAEVAQRLVVAYGQVTIGDPLDDGVLMGPLVTPEAVATFEAAVATAVDQGGEILTGGSVIDRRGNYVQPTIIRISADAPIVHEETFAPILYLIEFDDLDEAIEIHNGVPQGLSSAIFTDSVRSAERFLSAAGSDCGIANVNIGTSGAEIGGAFGGEKDTGGGRESGSDAWKAYMRRQTVTTNYGTDLPLAQGIEFG
ncbi:MAG: aldehyde dehydrogenase family protein [Acidimicrobiia bacterium]